MEYIEVLKEEGAMDVHLTYLNKPLPFHKHKKFHWDYNNVIYNYKYSFIDDIKQITYYIYEKKSLYKELSY